MNRLAVYEDLAKQANVTKRERRYVARLLDRMNWLHARIDADPVAYGPHGEDHRRSEYSALRWALERIVGEDLVRSWRQAMRLLDDGAATDDEEREVLS